MAALAAGQLACWAALYYAFSSFVLPMQRSVGWTSPQTMGAFTLGLVVWGVASYAVGAAIDRGRGRAVLTLGAVLGSLGMFLWSQAHTLTLLCAAWAVLGAAMAMTMYEPAFSVLAKRYPDRYREGITALTLVGGFASTLSFPAVAWLLAHLDWRGAVQVIGAVLLIVVAPLHAWALRGAKPQPITQRPRRDGAAVVAGDAIRRAGHRLGADATLREAMHQRSFWLLAAAFTLYSFAVGAVWAHIMPALAAKGLSATQAVAVVVWFGPAQVAGRFVYLLFGRRASSRVLGLTVLAGLPVALAIFALADQTTALLLFAVLFGVANGLVTIVRGGLVPEYFGREHVGRISGAMTSIALLARAAAPLATAWLLLALPGYREMLLVLVAVGMAAVAAFALAGAAAGSAR
ncbi:MAG TPA: MFS transporter [Burkholderiaceae bacterium]|nr:MFS transporter [Burkholderiaceae bacterium]